MNSPVGSTLNFVRHGEGKPLLLIHGLGSSLRTWDPIMPALAERRQVLALDLPGFGQSPPLTDDVSIASLTDAVDSFIAHHGLADVDVVGSSMGARMVLEMARRGHRGAVVSLDPGGFWTDTQVKVFAATVGTSIGLVRRIQPILPALTGNRVGRTALLLQFSAKPWRLDPHVVLRELRSFDAATSLDEALDALVHGPRQQGAPARHTGRQDDDRLGSPGPRHAPEPGRPRAGAVSRRLDALVRRLRPLPALGPARTDRAPHPRLHLSRLAPD